jgi:hypothetical protein
VEALTMAETLGTPITVPPAAPAVNPAGVDAPEAPPADTKPAKRPTTRAGRQAAAAAKRAAKAAAGGAKADSAPARPKPTKADVASSVAQLHTFAGGALPLLGLPMTGEALAASGPEAGKVWADVVRRYPQLERLFGASTDGLVLFRLLMVYAPIISLALSERTMPKADDGGMGGLAGMAGLMAQAGAAQAAMDAATRRPGPYAQDVPDGQNTGGRP